MKKANDLLKELGSEIIHEDNMFIIYEWKNKWGISYKLVFCLEQRCIELTGYGMYDTPFVRLKRSDLKAIERKMKELGWNI